MTEFKNSLDKKWDEIIKFNEQYFPNWRNIDEIYYSNALAGEVGELCNMVKHRVGGGTNKSYPNNYELMMELADIFIYLALLVEKSYADNTLFASIIQDKININIKRMESIKEQK